MGSPAPTGSPEVPTAGTTQITVVRFHIARTSLGQLLIAESDIGICAVTMGDDEVGLMGDLRRRFRVEEGLRPISSPTAWMQAVVGLVEHPLDPGEVPPLDVRGSLFQRQVWGRLREIPVGSTITYGDIAKDLGLSGYEVLRAVGQACGDNPVAIAVPCHRVVKSDGSLSGYRWGVERKRMLLERESAQQRLL